MAQKTHTAGAEAQVDAKLLELLVCPLTKTALDYDPINRELISRAAHLAYPIKDGIPWMAIDTARRLDEAKP